MEVFSTYQGLPGAPIDWCCLTFVCKLSKKIIISYFASEIELTHFQMHFCQLFISIPSGLEMDLEQTVF